MLTNTLQNNLFEIAEKELAKYSCANVDKYRNRLTYELEVYANLGYSQYVMALYDLVSELKRNAILFRIIGPCNSSLVLYCLGLSELDPIKYGFFFERFEAPLRRQFQVLEIKLPDEESICVASRFMDEHYKSTRIDFAVDPTLRSIRDVVSRITQNEKKYINLSEIPTDDTSAYKKLLVDIDAKPENLKELADCFVTRNLDIIYEDDMMIEMMKMSGCSLEEAYLLMKAIIMKKHDLQERVYAFKGMCSKKNVAIEHAEQRMNFWNEMKLWTVNKAGHYARVFLEYQLAWLEVHYPDHFGQCHVLASPRLIFNPSKFTQI